MPVISPIFPIHPFQNSAHENIGFVDAAAAINESIKELSVFVINRDWENTRLLELEAGAFDGCSLREHIRLHSGDMDMVNIYEKPDNVLPMVNVDASFRNRKMTMLIRRLSWIVFRTEAKGMQGGFS